MFFDGAVLKRMDHDVEKEDIKAKVQSAIALHNEGKVAAAKEIYEQVATLYPNHFTTLHLLGLAFYQLGQFDRAVDLFLRAIAVNEKVPSVHKNLGNAFDYLNRLDEAVASYDRAIALDPAFAAAYNDRGNALTKLHRFDDAIASYSKAITLKHDYPEAYNNLGVALNDAKRHVEALANFEHAIRLKPDFSAARRNQETALADILQWNLVFRYKSMFGVMPRLNPPVGYNERILHRIIYDRDPKLRIACDKVAVRRFIEERVGAEFVVPLLGAWEHASEIDWDKLPEKFVLKPSHSSGPFTIVDRSIEMNKEKLTAEAEEWISYDYFYKALEWAYRGIPRRILAEPFLCSSDGSPAPEAQVYVFYGKAALINVLEGTKCTPERKTCWLDATGRRVAIKKMGNTSPLELSYSDRKKLVEVAERVSHDFNSLRVDFFITGTGLKIGELTPYTLGGTAKWDPPELDDIVGKLWKPDFDLSTIPDYKGDP